MGRVEAGGLSRVLDLRLQVPRLPSKLLSADT